MKRGKPKHFFVEITDMYGGTANYSWVTRHKVRATTPRGAVHRITKAVGIGYRKRFDDGMLAQYVSTSGATCVFVEEWDDYAHSRHLNVNEEMT